MELEEIRTLTIQTLKIFSTYAEDSDMFPQLKQVDNVLRKVKEMMYVRQPNSPNA